MKFPFLSEQVLEETVLNYGSPTYLYNFHKIDEQFSNLEDFLPENFRVHYAMKANSNLAICHRLARLGASADISSIGELNVALKAGFLPEMIVFTGPGKTNLDLSTALDRGIGLFVVESVNEARRLNQLAKEHNLKQDILMRINPLYRTAQSCEIREGGSQCNSDLASESRPPIQLISQSASKFGIDEEQVLDAIAEMSSLENLNFQGIHIFTESNLLNYQQFLNSCQNTINIANRIQDSGYPIAIVDFGGGIGIPYNTVDAEFDVKAFSHAFQAVSESNPYKYQFLLEIGRYIVGEAGCYISEIVDIKTSQGKKFFILDGGVHNILRFSMKKASRFMNILGNDNPETEPVTFAGKLPTPLDIMVEDVSVPKDTKIGDKVVIYHCGAYGFNHSITNFVLHPYPAEVAYCDGEIQLIREPGKVEDFLVNQKSPWVENLAHFTPLSVKPSTHNQKTSENDANLTKI